MKSTVHLKTPIFWVSESIGQKRTFLSHVTEGKRQSRTVCHDAHKRNVKRDKPARPLPW
jgi:hypothetical protein